jgi:hypothetical protein
MGHDGKYGQVTTERKEIPEDEPVIVLRAQDELAVEAIDFYRRRCDEEGAGDEHLAAIDKTAQAFEAWQRDHRTKLPDTQPGEYE